MKENGIWEYRFKVRSFDVDKTNRMTPTAISEYLQEVAGEHANSVGFGYRQVIEQQMVWVLNGIRIEVLRMPVWEENIRIETWVVGNERFISRRDFRWYDEQGNNVLNATTNWILYHTERHRPQLVDQMNFPVQMHPELLATSSAVQNIRHKFEKATKTEYRVRYSDLDMVGHMNNTKYIQVLMDSYAPGFHQQNSFKSLDINFKAEARFDDLLILSSQAEEPCFYHQLQRAEDGKVNCMARIEW